MKLKPCPFCGFTPFLRDEPGYPRWELGCPQSEKGWCWYIDSSFSDDKKALVKRWNRRSYKEVKEKIKK